MWAAALSTCLPRNGGLYLEIVSQINYVNLFGCFCQGRHFILATGSRTKTFFVLILEYLHVWCLCVWERVRMYVQACFYLCTEAIWECYMSCLIILCPIYLRQDLSLNLVFMDLASLAGQKVPRSTCLQGPNVELCLDFACMVGIQTWDYTLAQALLPSDPSSQPPHLGVNKNKIWC